MNDFSPGPLETYLHEHIPMSKAMKVQVLSAGEKGVLLSAPLEPNLNHRGTAFGGSVSTLGILSAWAYLHAALSDGVNTYRIVIQKNETNYLQPISSAFTAFCPGPPPEVLDRFLAALERKGKGRIGLRASVRCGGIEAATFFGDYVAVRLADGND